MSKRTGVGAHDTLNLQLHSHTCGNTLRRLATNETALNAMAPDSDTLVQERQ